MYIDFYYLGPLLFVIGFFITTSVFFNTDNNKHRIIYITLALLLGIRYFYWRFTDTVLPYPDINIEFFWIWVIFIFEFLVFLEILIFFTLMTKKVNRSKQADYYENLMKISGNYPSVDVIIPTYDEPRDVLEKTMIGARNIDYPNFKVWVLDDGKRLWLKELSKELGINYLTRNNNKHAKAGNMNAALKYLKGDLINIFDADFVAHRNFLKRTTGFFQDKEIGILQTPQHFFNKDPIQINLGISEDWPDEQRLFFDKMAESRDAWDVSFCCGSCSVIRREALKKVGDEFPTESITEDLLTTLKLYRVGYKTRYLNEKLSMGLAAESLEGFFVQRERWCQGGIQTIFLKEGPFGKGINWFKRVMFFPLSWLVQAPSRVLFILIPVIYLWFGIMPLNFTTLNEILYYQLPMLAGYFLTSMWLMPKHYIPILSNAQSVFTAFRLLPVVLSSLIKPFGKPFKVTPKGSNNNASYFDGVSFTIIITLIFLTLAGVLVNMFPETRILTSQNFFPVAMFWAFLNIVILLITLLICFDRIRNRKEERFKTSEKALLLNNNNYDIIELVNLSVSGLKFKYNSPIKKIKGIKLKNMSIPVRLNVINNNEKEKIITATFQHSRKSHIEIIEKLFSGEYSNSIESIRTRNIIKNIFKNFIN